MSKLLQLVPQKGQISDVKEKVVEGDNSEISKLLQFVPQVAEIFDVKDKVGEGTFSKVFRALIKHNSKKQEFALKYLIPTSKPSRIASELQCLKEIGGTNNVVGIEFCLMNKGHVVIVMPYFPHQRFSDYVRHMSVDDTREYMKNLFIALSRIHSLGIIHRDIKPNNFLYNKTSKNYTLVDFGLAQRVADVESSKLCVSRQPLSDSAGRFNKNRIAQKHQDAMLDFKASLKHIVNSENVSKKRKYTQHSVEEPSPTTNGIATKNPSRKESSKKVKECGCFKKPTVCKVCLGRDPEEAPRGGTPGFRAPEVLLKHKHQTTAIDMWSAGVILLSILSKKHPFFRADDDITALAEIAFLVGTKEMKEAAASFGKIVTMNLPESTESVSEMRKQLNPARFLQAMCLLIQQEQPCFIHLNAKENEPRVRCQTCHTLSKTFPESAFDLVNRLLDPNPHTRIMASEALHHPFITNEALYINT